MKISVRFRLVGRHYRNVRVQQWVGVFCVTCKASGSRVVVRWIGDCVGSLLADGVFRGAMSPGRMRSRSRGLTAAGRHQARQTCSRNRRGSIATRQVCPDRWAQARRVGSPVLRHPHVAVGPRDDRECGEVRSGCFGNPVRFAHRRGGTMPSDG
jgi:hypothetical protein